VNINETAQIWLFLSETNLVIDDVIPVENENVLYALLSKMSHQATIYLSCFQQLGPIVLYSSENSLLDQYNNFRQNLAHSEICDEIDALLQYYRSLEVPDILVSTLKHVQDAKPFDIDKFEYRRLFDLIQTDEILIIMNSDTDRGRLINALYHKFMNHLAQHIRYDRELIIRQLDPAFVHDFTMNDLEEIVKIMSMDTKSTTNESILNQRLQIEKLLEIRRRQLVPSIYSFVGCNCPPEKPMSITPKGRALIQQLRDEYDSATHYMRTIPDAIQNSTNRTGVLALSSKHWE